MRQPAPGPTPFEREVHSRFGLIPNFFGAAPDAPEIVERLWDFAKSGYLDNPIPSLFKERLFVYLSRFCEVRYCIVRHCAFLLGSGHSSGDPSAAPQSVEQVIRLLKAPPPWQRNSDAVLSALNAGPTGVAWPNPETELEDHIFTAATLVFVQPGRAEGARQALRHALGAIATSICSGCWRSFGRRTTGPSFIPTLKARTMCAPSSPLTRNLRAC